MANKPIFFRPSSSVLVERESEKKDSPLCYLPEENFFLALVLFSLSDDVWCPRNLQDKNLACAGARVQEP